MKKYLFCFTVIIALMSLCCASVFAATELENHPQSNGNGYINVLSTSSPYKVAFNTAPTINYLRDMVHTAHFDNMLYEQWYTTHYGSITGESAQLITISNLEGVSDYSCITICYDNYVNLGIYSSKADYHRLIRATLAFMSSFPINYVEVSLRNIDSYGLTRDVFASTGLISWGLSQQRPGEELRYDYTASPEISNINFLNSLYYPPQFRICVDVYFTSDPSQGFVKLYNDLRLNDGDIVIVNSQAVYVGDGSDGDDPLTEFPPLPPSWNQDVYPMPDDEILNQEQNLADQIVNGSFSSSLSNWDLLKDEFFLNISQFTLAMSHVSVLMQYVSNIPYLNFVIVFSLVLGIIAFVLGMSSLISRFF